MLAGWPKASSSLLPQIELRLDQRGQTYTIAGMLIFSHGGGRRRELYKFAFSKYEKLGARDVYRHMKVETTAFHIWRKKDVDRLRFDVWLFRLEPTQAEKGSLAQLLDDLRVPSDSGVFAIRSDAR